VTSQAERIASLSPVDQRPEIGGRDAFAEMFDQHARHLFDYCCGLLGDRARAASATQVTLIAGHSLAGRLQDPSRMRAWLLALGRWECLTGNQPGSRAGESTLPSGPAGELAEALAFVDTADDDVAEEPPAELRWSDGDAVGDSSARAALDALPRGDREVLDLVYRHAVSIADLPAVLAIPASGAPGVLAAARAKFEKAVAAAGHGASADDPTGAGAHRADAAAADDSADFSAHWADAATAHRVTSPAYRLAAVPLASLPASVWRRTARVVMDPKFRSYREAVSAHAEHLGPDGFPVQAEIAQPPSGRRLLMASALMAGLLLAPPAAGAAGYVALSGTPPAAAPGHRPAVAPGISVSGRPAGSGPAQSSSHTRQSGSKRLGSKTAHKPPGGGAPRPRTSSPGTWRHSASPSPTSKFSPPTPSSSPSQSPSSSPTGSPSSPSSTPTVTPSGTTSSP
jgi:DNA-directed RNA polymerase specialized sigma24 family protein